MSLSFAPEAAIHPFGDETHFTGADIRAMDALADPSGAIVNALSSMLMPRHEVLVLRRFDLPRSFRCFAILRQSIRELFAHG